MGIQINGSSDTISAADGSLTLEGAELGTVSGINVTGVVTATSYQGDGSALTGIGAGTSISVLNTNVTVSDTGSDGTITFTTDGNTALTLESDQDASFDGRIFVKSNTTTGVVAGSAYLALNYNTTSKAFITSYDASGNLDDLTIDGDNIKFRVGSFSQAVTIDSSGNMGVGTASPTSLHHIESSGTTAYTVTAGSANSANIWFGDSSDRNIGRIVYQNSDDSMRFHTNGAERGRIDSDGRLLINGTTSQTWSGGAPLLQVSGTSASGTMHLGAFQYSNSSDGGELVLGSSRGTTVGSTTIVQNGDTLGRIRFCAADGNDLTNRGGEITCQIDGTPGADDIPTRMIFYTAADGAGSPTQRVWITSKGAVKITNTGNFVNSSGASNEIKFGTDGTDALTFENTATAPYSININHATSTNNSSNYFLLCRDQGTQRFGLRTNGGLHNYSGNNVNLSDEREKKNIVNLDSTWDCLKHWELKKFHYNEDADDDDLRYGVIAQQVAPHCPEVITDWVKQQAADAVLDEDGNEVEPAREEIVRMGVKEQQMMWMSIKSLQEAQTRIETLETANASQAATIAALDARLTALEGGN